MKSFKKVLCFGLASAMALGMTACKNDEPDVTAQELVENWANKSGEYVSMSLDMEMTSVSAGEETSTRLTSTTESAGDVGHSVMEMELTTSGAVLSFSGESWADSEYSYTNMNLFGEETGWTRTTNIYGDLDTSVGMMQGASNYAIVEHKAGKDYVVTWEIDSSALVAMTGTTDIGVSTPSTEGGKVTVTAHFDGETQDLKSMEAEATDIGDSTGTVSVKAVATVNEVDETKTLTIPNDVILSAEINDSAGEDSDTKPEG